MFATGKHTVTVRYSIYMINNDICIYIYIIIYYNVISWELGILCHRRENISFLSFTVIITHTILLQFPLVVTILGIWNAENTLVDGT